MNVYDFDKTIYQRDSSFDFILYLYSKKPYLIFTCGFKSLIALIKYYIFKKGSKEEMKEILFSILKYFDKREELINNFWDKNIKDIKTFYLQQKKDDDLIISASPLFLIKPICDRLNVASIASPLNLNTLKYEGKNCHGKEKVIQFQKYYHQEIEAFYSDSLSDTPLALLAKKAYLVKGDKIIVWKKEENK